LLSLWGAAQSGQILLDPEPPLFPASQRQTKKKTRDVIEVDDSQQVSNSETLASTQNPKALCSNKKELSKPFLLALGVGLLLGQQEF
jgi:hypothetical protein